MSNQSRTRIQSQPGSAAVSASGSGSVSGGSGSGGRIPTLNTLGSGGGKDHQGQASAGQYSNGGTPNTNLDGGGTAHAHRSHPLFFQPGPGGHAQPFSPNGIGTFIPPSSILPHSSASTGTAAALLRPLPPQSPRSFQSPASLPSGLNSASSSPIMRYGYPNLYVDDGHGRSASASASAAGSSSVSHARATGQQSGTGDNTNGSMSRDGVRTSGPYAPPPPSSTMNVHHPSGIAPGIYPGHSSYLPSVGGQAYSPYTEHQPRPPYIHMDTSNGGAAPFSHPDTWEEFTRRLSGAGGQDQGSGHYMNGSSLVEPTSDNHNEALNSAQQRQRRQSDNNIAAASTKGSAVPSSGTSSAQLASRRKSAQGSSSLQYQSKSGTDEEPNTISDVSGTGSRRSSAGSTDRAAIATHMTMSAVQERRPAAPQRKHKNGSTFAPNELVDKIKGALVDEADGDEDDDAEGEDKVDHRKRKRNRTIRSCVPCHKHKRKCDRKRPCGRCIALGLTGTCVYEVEESRDQRDPNVSEPDRLRRRIAELEQVVRELRQGQPRRSSPGPPLAPAAASTPILNVEEPDLKKRRVIVDRFARFKIDEAALAEVAAYAAANPASINGDTTSPVAEVAPTSAMASDISRQAATHSPEEKISISINGSTTEPSAQAQAEGSKDYRAEPYRTWLEPGEEMLTDAKGRRTFLGAPAGKSMLRRIRQLTAAKAGGRISLNPEDELLSVPEDNAFGIVLPDMRKTFPFTTIWSHENFSGEIIGLLPTRDQAELLLQAWKEEVVNIILGYHVPTLEAEYLRFFEMTTEEKMNVPMSCLAVYLMICSCGCVMRAAKLELFGPEFPASQTTSLGMSMKDPKDLTCSRLQSELYLSAAYQALRLCSFLSNPTIYTIQAQLLINVYLYASERASDSWALLGSLVRQCVSIGLHVDPVSLDANVSIRDAEVRRRLWWSVAGLDCLLCVLFGRPPCITYYTTALPQDRTDDNLPDTPGSAAQQLPPSNVLRNETTDMTFHAAYFQLTIPSYELLSRVFPMKRSYSRSTLYGWFSPSPSATASANNKDDDDKPNTYEDALRLAKDIRTWYGNLPQGIRYDPDHDSPEVMLKTRGRLIINQTIMLCIKTYCLIMILHRPYLRLDPAAYPESRDLVLNAAIMTLQAYELAFVTKASVSWVWWSVAYRAFHAGAVCAFLAIREPGTPLAKRCLDQLRNSIAVFEDRLAGWHKAHPVQAELVTGLHRLERLASAATAQPRSSPAPPPTLYIDTSLIGSPNRAAHGRPGSSGSSGRGGLSSADGTLPSPSQLGFFPFLHRNSINSNNQSYQPATGSSGGPGGANPSPTHLAPPTAGQGPFHGFAHSPNHASNQTLHSGHVSPATPLSLIRGFPDLGSTSPNLQPSAVASTFPLLSPGGLLGVGGGANGTPSSPNIFAGTSGYGMFGTGTGTGVGTGSGAGSGNGLVPGAGTGGLGLPPSAAAGSMNGGGGMDFSSPYGGLSFGGGAGSQDNSMPLGAETLALPQYWADMFGIKMDGDVQGAMH